MPYIVTSYRIYKKNGHVYTSQWNDLTVSCKTFKDVLDLKSNLRGAFKKESPDLEVDVDLGYKTL